MVLFIVNAFCSPSDKSLYFKGGAVAMIQNMDIRNVDK